jgi:hypothetical protein
MELGTRNRFISLFIGELKTPIDPILRQIDYDDFQAPPRPDPEDKAAHKPALPGPESDELEVGRSPRPPLAEPDSWDLIHSHAVVPRSHPTDFANPTLRLPALPPATPEHGHGGGGGGQIGVRYVLRAEPKIDVAYDDGGHQMDMRVRQINALSDNDAVIPDSGALPSPQHDVADFATLKAIAAAEIPAELGSAATPEAIVDLLHDRAAHSEGIGAPLEAGTVQDGAAVSSEAPLPPDPTLLVPEAPMDKDANMAIVGTGGNAEGNFARLLDENGAIGTLIVLGDSHKSNAIVQTNVLVDQSVVEGESQAATVQIDGNAANNVASLIDTLDQNPYAMGFFGGLHWQVDRVDGDFYDVRLVTQVNDMRDNDHVQQVADAHYKFIDTGNNALINDVSGFDLSPYDLVIVGGNYYGANWIFQTNILLNSDYVQINGGADGEGQQTISTGANWLLNTATIADFTGASQSLTPGMRDVVTALQEGRETLNLEYGLNVAGNGGAKLDVLFISGDYYDLNILRQTNMMADSDTVIQTLGEGEAGYVATGGNVLTNDATIVDVEGLGGQYVAGNQYSESVLVQTNIIAQSADLPPSQSSLVMNDPGKLTPEAAVIIQHDPTPAAPPPDQSCNPAPTDSASHATPDPLSSVLS